MRRFYPFVLTLALATLPTFSRAQQPENPAPPPQANTDKQKPQPQSDEMPVTVKVGSSDKDKKHIDDPMGVPKLPDGKTSMIGGTVSKIDGIRNKMNVKIYGGGQWNLAFDERTHFFRDGHETTFENVKKGDRVYVDTMLDGHSILARNVRVVTKSSPVDASGQVTAFDGGVLRMNDSLSSRPVQFRVNGETQVKRNGRSASVADIQPGALIAVQFTREKENLGVAKEITVVAANGESVTFAGRVTHLDLSTGQLAVENRTDSRTYDIAFDTHRNLPSDLMVGSEVTVAAIFDGRRYMADRIDVDKAAQ